MLDLSRFAGPWCMVDLETGWRGDSAQLAMEAKDLAIKVLVLEIAPDDIRHRPVQRLKAARKDHNLALSCFFEEIA